MNQSPAVPRRLARPATAPPPRSTPRWPSSSETWGSSTSEALRLGRRGGGRRDAGEGCTSLVMVNDPRVSIVMYK